MTRSDTSTVQNLTQLYAVLSPWFKNMQNQLGMFTGFIKPFSVSQPAPLFINIYMKQMKKNFSSEHQSKRGKIQISDYACCTDIAIAKGGK